MVLAAPLQMPLVPVLLLAAASVLVAAGANPAMWYAYNDTNACPGALATGPAVRVVKGVATPAACESKCKAVPSPLASNNTSSPSPPTGAARCNVWSWSPNTKNCYLRNDTRWSPGWPNQGYHSGCLESAVWNCGYQPATARCPSHFLPPASHPPPPTPPATVVNTVTAWSDPRWCGSSTGSG